MATMNTPELAEIAAEVRYLALAAGNILLDGLGAAHVVDQKQGTEFVTEMDRRVEDFLLEELARRGHLVYGLSRSGTAPAGIAIKCDVTEEAMVRETFARIDTEAAIGGLVNNAGVHLASPAATLATADYETVMAVNATAVMVAAREAFPYLAAHAPAKIINMGSFFDKMGVPDNLAYCASKAAVAAITRCLATEWSSKGISIVNVAPGYVETPLNKDYLGREKIRQWMRERIPLGRVGTAAEVARFIGLLFEDDMPYLTGETIYMDGGHGMNH